MEHTSQIRINILASEYAKISVKHFLFAEQQLQQFRLSLDLSCEKFDYHEISRNIMVSVVFAFMVIESYINDYACRIMGDEFFNDNFQMLSPLSKLQLCYKLVTGYEINKNTTSCYSLLKKLTKQRNKYVHNKSFHFTGGMTKAEFDEYIKGVETGAINEVTEEEIVKSLISDLKKELSMGKDAIRTFYEFSVLIDSIDEKAHAQFQIWGKGGHSLHDNAYMKNMMNRFLG